MTLNTYPLSSLRLSPLNVRKVKPKAIEALAADIQSHGLLQNLIGYEESGKVMICAGGRRYRALKRLQKDKMINANHEVPVDIRPIEEALELSLAENSQREAMHPADAILAYRSLIEGGMEVEDIAARFGVSIEHVRRLLRLSGLHPKLMTELKRDGLSLASARALAICDDQQQQWDAFKQAGDNPNYLRSILTDEKLSCQSALFEFVGEESYLKEGGTLTRDLFSDEQESFADDVQLVRSLAEQRLGDIAETEKGKGWGEVQFSLERPDNFYSLSTLHPDAERDLSEEESQRLSAIKEQLEEFEKQDVPYYDERVRNLETEQRSIGNACRFHSEEQMARATLYLFVGHHGLQLHPVGKPQSDDRGETKPKPDYPTALLKDLGTIRNLALQEAIALNPDLALDILLDHSLGQLMGEACSFEQPLGIRLDAPNKEAKPELMEGSTIQPIEPLIADLLPKLEGAERLAKIGKLDEFDKARLLAFVVASQLTSVDLTGSGGAALNEYAALSGLDLSKVWQPNAAFFARLTKPVLLKLRAQHCGESAADNCKRLNKSDLAIQCSIRLSEAGYFPPCLESSHDDDEQPPWKVDEEETDQEANQEAIAA